MNSIRSNICDHSREKICQEENDKRANVEENENWASYFKISASWPSTKFEFFTHPKYQFTVFFSKSGSIEGENEDDDKDVYNEKRSSLSLSSSETYFLIDRLETLFAHASKLYVDKYHLSNKLIGKEMKMRQNYEKRKEAVDAEFTAACQLGELCRLLTNQLRDIQLAVGKIITTIIYFNELMNSDKCEEEVISLVLQFYSNHMKACTLTINGCDKVLRILDSAFCLMKRSNDLKPKKTSKTNLTEFDGIFRFNRKLTELQSSGAIPKSVSQFSKPCSKF